MLEADIPKDLARLENGPMGTSGSSAKSWPWDSNSLQWYRLGTGCLEHSSVEHRCGGQGAAEGSAASSSSTASSPSAVPAGSGKGLVLLYSLFLSPQLKRSAQFWDPQYRKALTYINKSGGGTPTSRLWSRAGAQDAGEKRRQKRHLLPGMQGSQRGSSERCPVGREEPIDSSQHGKFFLSVRGKCLWSW